MWFKPCNDPENIVSSRSSRHRVCISCATDIAGLPLTHLTIVSSRFDVFCVSRVVVPATSNHQPRPSYASFASTVPNSPKSARILSPR